MLVSKQKDILLSDRTGWTRVRPACSFIHLPGVYFVLPILNILVLHVGQVPVVAGFSFFIVTALGFFITFLALHLTQYPSTTWPPNNI